MAQNDSEIVNQSVINLVLFRFFIETLLMLREREIQGCKNHLDCAIHLLT
jgi:hypothetical protein